MGAQGGGSAELGSKGQWCERRLEGLQKERIAVPGGAIQKPSKSYELVALVTGCRVHKAGSSVSLIQYYVLRARTHSRFSISRCGMSE